MSEEKDERRGKTSIEEAEELKLVLSTVSTEIPALIKNIISSIFSEEAGRNMGKAAASFYKELKDSGIPDDVALKMTEDYMSAFTSLGNMLKQFGRGTKVKSKHFTPEKIEELEREIGKHLEDKVDEKLREKGLGSKSKG